VRLTAAKYGLRRHRKLRIARPQDSDSGSAPEDNELRTARPQGSDSGSTPEDDELRLARPQGSDSGSVPEGDELRLARPQGSDSGSAPEDRLDLDLGGASTSPNTRLRPTTSQEAPSLSYPKLT
jgi:translation initiation factor IF-2